MPVSLSGPYRKQGAQALRGISLWVEEVNRKGGLYVREQGGYLPLELRYYDDQSKRQKAAHIVRELIISDRVDLLMGPYSSALTVEAAAVASSLQRVLWNHGGASDAIYSANSPWVVGVLTAASRYMEGVLDLLQEELPGVRRVAIISSRRGSFPSAVASGAASYAIQRGFHALLTAQYDPTQEEFGAIIDQVRQSGAEVILGVGRIEDDLRLARELQEGRVEAAAVALVAVGIGRFKEELGTLAHGFMGPSQWELGAPHTVDYGPSVEEMAQRLKSRWEGSDYPMAQAYAAGLVAQRCVEEAGTLDNGALRRVAGELTFTTFYGPFRLDAATGRQIGHSTLVVQWHGGRKVIVWPRELRQAPALFPWRNKP